MGLGDKVRVTPLDVARLRGQEPAVLSTEDAPRRRGDDARFDAATKQFGLAMGSTAASRVIWDDTLDSYWDDMYVSPEHAYETQVKLFNKALAAAQGQ